MVEVVAQGWQDLLTVELTAVEDPSDFRNRVAIVHPRVRIVGRAHTRHGVDLSHRERPQLLQLGIALVERVVSDDPTALIGLPLIQLVTMLGNEGIEVG